MVRLFEKGQRGRGKKMGPVAGSERKCQESYH